ncbi:MAG TPA: hypothetical protein VFJ30_17145, partial [Phycisphaerae bacterium]|nr:hypothetical protein [Phycisphaerae bacterium]
MPHNTDRSRHWRTLAAWAMALAAGGGSALCPAAEEDALGRWAVIAAPALRQSGLADLVNAGLGRQPGITLVERDRLDAVFKEVTLAQMLGATGAGRRAEAGRILQADALVLLAEAGDGGQIEMVISDTRCGARLMVRHVPYDPRDPKPAAEELTAAIQATGKRFAGGIKRVLGMSHFINRSLLHDHDYLQAGYANLLAGALEAGAGVAVVETDEAHRIRQELALGGGADVRRFVPLLVEGEYRILAGDKTTGPQVQLSLKLRDANEAVVSLTPRPMALSAAAEYLRTTAAWNLLDNGAAPANGFSADRQFAALVARADAFARLGSWDDSLGLREAAVLLAPDNADQRVWIIRQTCRRVTLDWAAGETSPPERFRQARLRRLALRRRGFDHLTWLIRNRRIPGGEAIDLTEELIRSIYTVRATFSQTLTDEEKHKKRFLSEVYPLILDLPGGPPAPTDRMKWLDRLVELAALRCDGNFRLPEDLDFFARIVAEIAPPDMPLSASMIHMVASIAETCAVDKRDDYYNWYRFTTRQGLEFLDRLRTSRSARVRACGDFGMLVYDCVRSRDSEDPKTVKALLARCERMAAEHKEFHQKLSPQPRSCQLLDYLNESARRLRARLEPKTPTPDTPSRAQPAIRSTGRLTFEEVPMRIRRLDGSVVSAK